MHIEIKGYSMAASICILQKGVCVCSGARIFHSNKHRCHNSTDEVPSYFLALAGIIQVNFSLLDVSKAVEDGSCES